jgi:hypothetical protein
LYIHHADYALEVAAESFNVLGRVVLDVVYGAGREDDPEFERACLEWVRRREAVYPCYEVSWESEAAIDGHTAARRLYRAFTDLASAMVFIESGLSDACRLIDRRTGEAAVLHGAC